MTAGRKLTAWLVTWAVTAVGLPLTLLGAEECPTYSADEIHDAALASADWIVDNFQPDNRYLYVWDRDTQSAPDDYNLVRHAGTTMSLYQLIESGETSYLDAADRGLGWLLDRLFTVDTEDQQSAERELLAERGQSGPVSAVAIGRSNGKLGTVALLTVSLAHRRQATGDTTYDDLLRNLGRMMVVLWQPGGKMWDQWSQQNNAPRPNRTSLFATGEAMWALALLHVEFPGEGWDEYALGTMRYIATERDDDEDVFPRPWADQWAAYGLNEMATWDLGPDEIEYGRAIAAQFGIAVRWESQRNGAIGSLVHMPEPIAAGQGTWLEALGQLEMFAQIDPRMSDLASDLGDRLLCGAGRMVERQARDTGRVEEDGAWFKDGETRVDGQQHALSGLLFAEQLTRRRAAETTEGDR